MKRLAFIALAFLSVNIILEVCFLIKDTLSQNQIYRTYGKQKILKAYPNCHEKMVTSVLEHTWGRESVYDSIRYFKEAPVKSKYVNFHKEGYRLGSTNNPWPPKRENFNIFLFGGSTTFGYGQPDHNTISSILQKKLYNSKENVCVYNLGEGFYYSTQELLKFKYLVDNKIIPDLAIFLDGLNEFQYEDEFLIDVQQQLKPTFFNRTFHFFTERALVRIPLFLHHKFFSNKEEVPFDSKFIDHCIRRFIANKKGIENLAKSHNVELIHAIHPTPYYKYNLNYHLFLTEKDNDSIIEFGYKQLNKISHQENLFWLADIQQGKRQNLYVDKVHFTAQMNTIIAESLAKKIIEDRFYQELN